MENITQRMNLVIDYIETHLTSEIDPKEIERIACCSYFDVGRIFSLIAGINISDYIRKRKLTLAGTELKRDHAKVIDIAQKYGYDSPVSFARAFQAFHGFNPSIANKEEAMLNIYPRLLYQISVKGVIDAMKKETITINGNEYEASYFGESDMSSWSFEFCKRKYWRLENTGEDFQDAVGLDQVLPYNNYPPINIKVGDVFVIDYYTLDGNIERKYYLADGTVWQDMACTREILIEYKECIRTDIFNICGKQYQADYFGTQDISSWSTYATKREFWRLEDVSGEFDGCPVLCDVLPYNNYPHIKIETGQVFVIDYHTRAGAIERKYYIANGTVWRDMPSTQQILIEQTKA